MRVEVMDWYRVPLAIILAIGAVVRIALLDQPMRYDESSTVISFASQSLGHLLTDYSAPNNHIFHTLLVHLFTLGGTQYSEVLVRLPALLAGMAAIALTYAVGRAWYSAQVGILAAAWMTASAPMVEYATNARGYSLIVVCFLSLCLISTRLVDRSHIRDWLLWVLAAVIGVYTIPVMLYALAIVTMWLALLLIVRRRLAALCDLALALAATAVASLLLYLPVFAGSGLDAVIGNRFVAPLSWADLMHALPASWAETWTRWHAHLSPLAIAAIAFGLLSAIVLHRRTAPTYPVPILLAMALCIPILLIQRVAPYARVWLFLLPVYAIVSAAGWVALTRIVPRVTAVIAIGLCALLAINLPIDDTINPLDDLFAEDSAEAVALFVRDLTEGETRSVGVLPVSEALIFYFRKHGLSDRLFPARLDALDQDVLIIVVTTPEYTIERLIALLAQFGADFSPYMPPELLRIFPFSQVYGAVGLAR